MSSKSLKQYVTVLNDHLKIGNKYIPFNRIHQISAAQSHENENEVYLKISLLSEYGAQPYYFFVYHTDNIVLRNDHIDKLKEVSKYITDLYENWLLGTNI